MAFWAMFAPDRDRLPFSSTMEEGGRGYPRSTLEERGVFPARQFERCLKLSARGKELGVQPAGKSQDEERGNGFRT